jgi:hypothetical protein
MVTPVIFVFHCFDYRGFQILPSLYLSFPINLIYPEITIVILAALVTTFAFVILAHILALVKVITKVVTMLILVNILSMNLYYFGCHCFLFFAMVTKHCLAFHNLA